MFISFNLANSFGGGTFISENLYLTAAHCSPKKQDLGKTRVLQYFKDSTIPEDLQSSVMFKVLKVIDHPKFNKKNMDNGYDISIWVLEEIKESNPTNKRLSVYPEIADSTKVERGALTAIGFGIEDYNNPNAGLSKNLMKVEVQAIDNDAGSKMYLKYGIQKTFPENVLLASSKENGKEQDTAQGDSGGPLFRIIEGTPVLYGLTSYGLPSVYGLPAVYTRVAFYKGWIKSIMNQYKKD